MGLEWCWKELDIKDFLDHNFKVIDYDSFSDLQWILEKLGLSKSGRKEELIDRIVDNERFHPNKLYNWLTVDDLKRICGNMGLRVTANKPELWLSILEETNYFNNAYPDLKRKQGKKLAEIRNVIPSEDNKFLLLLIIWIGLALILTILHFLFPEFQFIIQFLIFLEVVGGIIGFIYWVYTKYKREQIPISDISVQDDTLIGVNVNEVKDHYNKLHTAILLGNVRSNTYQKQKSSIEKLAENERWGEIKVILEQTIKFASSTERKELDKCLGKDIVEKYIQDYIAREKNQV